MNKRRVSVGVGLCSMLMIFTCLVLTIFATLSYLQAKRNLNATNKIVDSIIDYYNADYRASELVLSLKDNYGDDTFLKENNIEYNNGVYTFSIAFSNKHLDVSVRFEQGKLIVLKWQEVSESNGEYDYSGFVN